jgi:hypothetical protein
MPNQTTCLLSRIELKIAGHSHWQSAVSVPPM